MAEKESKRKIMITALRLINENGYDSVTIGQICKEANIAKNTFYYYFASKDDLLFQFYVMPREDAATDIAGILEEPISIEQYWMSLTPLLNFIIENGPETMRNIILAQINRKISAFKSESEHLDLIEIRTAIIKRGQAAGEIRSGSDPRILQILAQTQLIGLLNMWCVSEGGFDLKKAVRLSIEVLLDVRPELRRGEPGVFDCL